MKYKNLGYSEKVKKVIVELGGTEEEANEIVSIRGAIFHSGLKLEEVERYLSKLENLTKTYLKIKETNYFRKK